MSQETIKLDYTAEEIDKNLGEVNNVKKAVGGRANAFRGKVSGEVVGLTDVSPIEHEMGVKVKSANILPYPYLAFANGDVQSRAGITITNQGDRGLHIKGTSTAPEGFKLAYIDLGSTWTDASSGVESATTKDGKYTISKYLCYDHTKKVVYVIVRAGITVDEIIYPQVVEGTVLTPYLEDISAVKVKKCGKNILDVANAPMFGNISDKYESILSYERKNGGFKFTALADGTVGATKVGYQVLPVSAVRGKNVTFSFKRNSEADDTNVTTCAIILTADAELTGDYTYVGGNLNNRLNYKEIKMREAVGGYFTYTFNVPQDETRKNIFVSFYCGSGAVVEQGNVIEYSDIQVEVGNVATEYEPYKGLAEYPVNVDGTVEGVTSIHPVTTLMSDTAGAVIDVEYNQDTNKVYEQLKTAVIALGGL